MLLTLSMLLSFALAVTHHGERASLADFVRLTQEAAREEVPSLPENHHLRVLPTSASNSLKRYNRCAVVGSSAILLSEVKSGNSISATSCSSMISFKIQVMVQVLMRLIWLCDSTGRHCAALRRMLVEGPIS